MLISLIITTAIVLIWIILAYISERFEIPSAFRDGIIAFIGMAGMCIIVWILKMGIFGQDSFLLYRYRQNGLNLSVSLDLHGLGCYNKGILQQGGRSWK